MPYTHVIEAASAEDFKKQVQELNQLFSGPLPGAPAPLEEKAEQEGPSPSKVAKKAKKSAEVELAGEPVHKEQEEDFDPFASAEQETPVPNITVEDVKAALMKVKGKFHMQAVLDIIKSFGAASISQIKQADFPAVMVAAEKALAQ